ncbi:MAG: VanZ family protein [Clostridiales bacterium]|nr:VanZ family protein [Clostridiales bacterium]
MAFAYIVVFKVPSYSARLAFQARRMFYLSANFTPLREISRLLRDGNYAPLIGNILVTVPLPWLLYWDFRRLGAKKAGALAMLLTLLIEPFQALIDLLYRFPANVIDVDDAILNASGCIIGIFAIYLCIFLKKSKKSKKNS